MFHLLIMLFPITFLMCFCFWINQLTILLNFKSIFVLKQLFIINCGKLPQVSYFCCNVLQLCYVNVIPLVERKDVSFIFTIFPKNFWNKWYLIWKPLYRVFRISKKIGRGIILRVASPLNWKSTTFTKTRLEPFMTEILPVSKLLSNYTL